MTNTTALPTGPTRLPGGPERVDIEPAHLILNQTWKSGSIRNIHPAENGNIAVILSRGRTKSTQSIPEKAHEGTVIALDVDGDHDEAHCSSRAFVNGAEETLSQGPRGAGGVPQRPCAGAASLTSDTERPRHQMCQVGGLPYDPHCVPRRRR